MVQPKREPLPLSSSISTLLDQWETLPRPTADPVLAGKTVVVTGANTGIGYETALHFAACAPSRLILAVRNMKSGAEALEKILRKHPSVRVEVWELDISEYASVKAFAARAEKELDQLDILVNNAGVNSGLYPKPLQRSKDGHEHTVQVNVLSTVLLSLLLLPLLTKSQGPRLTFVTSAVHAISPTSLMTDAISQGNNVLAAFDDEEQYLNPVRYHESKLLLQMIVRKLIPALPDITVVAVTPGLCRTSLLRERPALNLALIPAIAWFMIASRSPEMGARNVTVATLSATDSSEYWANCQAKASASPFLASGSGARATDKLWAEVLVEMESVAPGCTTKLKL